MSAEGNGRGADPVAVGVVQQEQGELSPTLRAAFEKLHAILSDPASALSTDPKIVEVLNDPKPRVMVVGSTAEAQQFGLTIHQVSREVSQAADSEPDVTHTAYSDKEAGHMHGVEAGSQQMVFMSWLDAQHRLGDDDKYVTNRRLIGFLFAAHDALEKGGKLVIVDNQHSGIHEKFPDIVPILKSFGFDILTSEEIAPVAADSDEPKKILYVASKQEVLLVRENRNLIRQFDINLKNIMTPFYMGIDVEESSDGGRKKSAMVNSIIRRLSTRKQLINAVLPQFHSSPYADMRSLGKIVQDCQESFTSLIQHLTNVHEAIVRHADDIERNTAVDLVMADYKAMAQYMKDIRATNVYSAYRKTLPEDIRKHYMEEDEEYV